MENYYRINTNTVIIENNSYITYGISYCKKDIIIETIFDISLNRNEVEKLCDFLNNHQIPYVHFKDIVEDFLA